MSETLIIRASESKPFELGAKEKFCIVALFSILNQHV